MSDGNKDSGTITLEASIVVPLFIMLMLFVNGFFVLFMGQQIMTHTLIQSTKSLAFDPYATERCKSSSENLAETFADVFTLVGGNRVSTEEWYLDSYGDLDKVVEERFVNFLASSKDDAKKKLDVIGIQNEISGLDFSESKVENGTLTVKLKYKQEFLFNVFDFTTMNRTLEVKVKLFEYK